MSDKKIVGGPDPIEEFFETLKKETGAQDVLVLAHNKDGGFIVRCTSNHAVVSFGLLQMGLRSVNEGLDRARDMARPKLVPAAGLPTQQPPSQ